MRCLALVVALPCLPCVEAQTGLTEQAVVERFAKLQKTHPFFQKVTCSTVSRPPFVFFIQRPDKDDPLYDNKIVNHHLSFLKAQVKLFEDEYVRPGGLQLSPDGGVYPIVVLSSQGSYRNYSQAVSDTGLHMARAHYDPELRLAITYEDAFAQDNAGPTTRHAIRHEFVHALQHAYSLTKGMTDALWFAEGQADYRAAATNLPESLAKPPLIDHHLTLLAQVQGTANLRAIQSTVEELVSIRSYAEVVRRVGQRSNGFKQGDILAVFYAQSEMLVRFLHEASDGKYKAGFQRYTREVLSGANPKGAFVAVFGQDGKLDFERFETEFNDWLLHVLRGGAASGSGAGDAAVAKAPEPTRFDAAALQWTAAETEGRLDLARRLAAAGDFAGALQALPQATDGIVARDKARLEAGLALRHAVIDDAVQRKAQLPVFVDGAETRLKVVKRDGDALFVQGKKGEQRLGTGGIALATLLREGARLKRFDGIERWLDGWLRWLDGAPLASLKKQFDGGHSKMVALREDCTAEFGDRGRDGLALAWLQQVQLPDDATAAAALLAEFEAKVVPWLAKPALSGRRAALESLVRVLAERSFDPGDPAGMGIAASCERLADGRLRATYDVKNAAALTDFALAKAPSFKALLDVLPKLAFDGPPTLRREADGVQMVGSGMFEWVVDLEGPQAVEVQWLPKEGTYFIVILARDEEQGGLFVSPFGTVHVVDLASRIDDEVGSSAQLTADQPSKLRIEHDGNKRLQVTVDGKRTADVQSTGKRNSGRVCLLVHTSTAVQIQRLVLEGKPKVGDLAVARHRHGDSVVSKLLR